MRRLSQVPYFRPNIRHVGFQSVPNSTLRDCDRPSRRPAPSVVRSCLPCAAPSQIPSTWAPSTQNQQLSQNNICSSIVWPPLACISAPSREPRFVCSRQLTHPAWPEGWPRGRGGLARRRQGTATAERGCPPVRLNHHRGGRRAGWNDGPTNATQSLDERPLRRHHGGQAGPHRPDFVASSSGTALPDRPAGRASNDLTSSAAAAGAESMQKSAHDPRSGGGGTRVGVGRRQ